MDAETREAIDALGRAIEDFKAAHAAEIREVKQRGITSALKTRLDDMQTRLSRISKRSEKKRALVTSAMERAGLKKLAEADFTVSLRHRGRPFWLTMRRLFRRRSGSRSRQSSTVRR